MGEIAEAGICKVYKAVFTMTPTCHDIKMNAFIPILIGQVPQPTYWEDLYSEYLSLRENRQSSFILDILKEIAHLQTKVFIIEQCVKVLANTYSRDLVNELKLCGPRGRFDWSNKEQYSNDLKGALTFAKKYISQYNRKQKDLEDYQKRNGGVITRKDFDIWAVTLGKFMGYRIDYDVVTVTEFCHMMNQYEKYCEVQNAESNNLIKPQGHGRG